MGGKQGVKRIGRRIVTGTWATLVGAALGAGFAFTFSFGTPRFNTVPVMTPTQRMAFVVGLAAYGGLLGAIDAARPSKRVSRLLAILCAPVPVLVAQHVFGLNQGGLVEVLLVAAFGAWIIGALHDRVPELEREAATRTRQAVIPMKWRPERRVVVMRQDNGEVPCPRPEREA